MIKKEVRVINPAGIHTRPASEIVRIASKFKSKILLEVDGFTVNAKSILGLMGFPAQYGTYVKIIADGEDESEAVDDVSKLFENGFGEI